MCKRLFGIACFFLWGVVAQAQTKVNPEQEKVAIRFMHYLEKKIPDSALLLMDTNRPKEIAYFKKGSTQAMQDIEAIVKKTYPSMMLIGGPGERFYQCKYRLPKENYPDFYAVEIFFPDEKTRKICRVKFYNRKDLIQETILQREAGKRPPPPPPVIKQ